MAVNGVDVVEQLRGRMKFFHVGDRLRNDLGKACEQMSASEARHIQDKDTINGLLGIIGNKGIKLTRTWSGFVDMTPDFLPIIGPVDKPKGLYLATGFSGHGFALGPIVGKMMADLVIEGQTSMSIHSFRPSRFAEGRVRVPKRLM